MSTDTKRLMLEQFQGKTQDELIESLINPINKLIDKSQLINGHGIKLESGLGVEFKEFSIDVPDDWIYVKHDVEPFFLNSWTNVGANHDQLAFRKDQFGLVHIKGLVKSGTIGLVPVFNLPELYRPAENDSILQATASNGAYGQIEVRSDPASPATLGDVCATVGNNAWFSVRISFLAEDRTPIIPSCFPYNTKVAAQRVADVRLVQVLDSSNNPISTAALSLDWSHLKDGRVQIRNIPGLKPITSYKITVAVFPR